jgi:hypothetical protein
MGWDKTHRTKMGSQAQIFGSNFLQWESNSTPQSRKSSINFRYFLPPENLVFSAKNAGMEQKIQSRRIQAW